MSELHLGPDAGPAESVGDTVDVWSYLIVLLQRRYLVLGLAVVAAVATAARSLSSPREYSAAASFVPQEATAQTGLSQIASQLGLGTGRTSTSSQQFYVALLQSRDLLREAATGTYSAEGSAPFRGDLVAFFGLLSAERERSVAKAVERLRTALTIRANPSTGVVRFDVRTRQPQVSLQVAQRLLGLVNDYNLRRRQSQARAEREFVEQRLASTQQALTAAEDAIALFYARNRSYGDAPELVAEEARLQRQVSIRQQVYLTLAQSHEVAKIEEVRNTPVITVVEHPEGFVERAARGTVSKTLVAFTGGVLVGVALAFALEFLAAARSTRSGRYQAVVSLGRQALSDLRGGVFRRRRG